VSFSLYSKAFRNETPFLLFCEYVKNTHMKIDESSLFFSKNDQIAVVGVSQNPKQFGRMVYNHLKKNGYNVVPVNPNTHEINGTICYNSISDVPNTVTKALVITPSQNTDLVLRSIAQKGIQNVWIQNMCESKESELIAKELHLKYVTKKCACMFAEPVVGIHKFHRGLLSFFGKI